MKLPISLTVNGEEIQALVEPRTHLADFLREELRLTATHLGCEHGVCGACTVVMDGAIVRSCLTLAVAANGAEVRTLEGFADDPRMAAVKAAFHEEHGLQCGFCTPGMLVTALDLLSRNGDPTPAEIRAGIAGNLCRCTGYQGIVRSIARAAETLSEKEEA